MEDEPLNALVQVPTWQQDESAFHMGLQQQLGRRIEILQSDVQWQFPVWRQDMVAMQRYAHEQNMQYGVIYDGNAESQSDAQWINSDVTNFETVEGTLQIIPDTVAFTSWDSYPIYNMPETSPTAQTWLINRYVRPDRRCKPSSWARERRENSRRWTASRSSGQPSTAISPAWTSRSRCR